MTSLSDDAWVLWGKSDPHVPLIVHLLDVGACVLEVLAREQPPVRATLARDFGLPEEDAVRLVAFLGALHDLGKATPAFQTLWPQGWAATRTRLGGPSDLDEHTGHGRAGFDNEVLPLTLTDLLKLSSGRARAVAHALACHHGSPISEDALSDRHAQIGLTDAWSDARFDLAEAVMAAFGVQDQTLAHLTRWDGGPWMRLAGLVSFADWIGSSFWQVDDDLRTQTEAFTTWAHEASAAHARARLNPADYLENVARPRARERLDQIGWRPRRAFYDQVPDFTTLFPKLKDPRALQLALLRGVQEVLAPNPPPGVAGTWAATDPVLALVEAPMGEGKTEAALHAALQLQTAFDHRGLYFALPTQATGDGMYARVHDFLSHVSRDTGRATDLHLLHGGRLLNDAYQEALRAQPNTRHNRAEGVIAERWFGDRKRGLLAEHGVGTLDQALLGVLPVKHQFVRLWGLGGRVIVMDEVHAYDAYTGTLLVTLLRWLRAMGSSVILMSATLPAHTRRALLGAWQDQPPARVTLPDQPYPRVTLARGSALLTEDAARQAPLRPGGPAPKSRPPLKLALRAVPADETALARQAAQLVKDGGCAVIIVNLVARAQRISRLVKRALKAQGNCARRPGEPTDPDETVLMTLHARLPAAERQARDTCLRDLLGKPSEERPSRRPHRMIVVATQVAEQSLDIDADVMISDLAPVDLLLQRAGRLHRHNTNNGRRAGHDAPVLYVAGLTDWPASAMKEYGWQFIYARSHLLRTWTVLRGRGEITLPTDIEPLVEQVHGDSDLTGGLEEDQARTLRKAEQKFTRTILKHQQLGRHSSIRLPDSFQPMPPRPGPLLSDEDRETLGTRLGEPTVRLVPLHALNGDEDCLSLHPEKAVTAGLRSLDGRDGQRVARAIYAQHIRVARRELVAELLPQVEHGSPRARAWKNDPLLRDCVPVVFTDGHSDVGGVHLELDDELGLIYHDPWHPMPAPME